MAKNKQPRHRNRAIAASYSTFFSCLPAFSSSALTGCSKAEGIIRPPSGPDAQEVIKIRSKPQRIILQKNALGWGVPWLRTLLFQLVRYVVFLYETLTELYKELRAIFRRLDR